MADTKMNKQNENMSNPQTRKNEPTGSQQDRLSGESREQGQFSGQERHKSAIGEQTGQFDKNEKFDKNKERERTDR